MTTTTTWLARTAVALLTAMSASAQQPAAPVNAMAPDMPKQTTRTGKHVNRVIELWLKGQPVYYAQISGGGYDKGKEMAATKADYITYEMEHGPLDFKELREFMRGLVDAGPTSGHKTPAVIVTLPISGTTDALRANAWMIEQTLAAGVLGPLCRASRSRNGVPADHGCSSCWAAAGTYQVGGEASPQMGGGSVARVLNATKAAGIKFLNACNEDNVIDQIKDGTMI